jgi:stearoyl-CoA desaturase (delta-9 desaturase)
MTTRYASESMPGYAVLAHPWWVPLLFIVVLGHITNICTTLYLHRSETHGGVEFHPIVKHAMRFWLWLTSGVVTREWVAVHRKHHAFADREGDPHSPAVVGLSGILFTGLVFYQKAANDPETLEKYGKGCPDDWVERNIYTRHRSRGIQFMLLVDVFLFGIIVGPLVWLGMVIWVPIMGNIINGLGHALGYRNFSTRDESQNLYPWGIWILGEELHNNHHADPRSAKFKARWWEFDIGWMYIRLLSALRLAKVVYARSLGVREFAARYYAEKVSRPMQERLDRATERFESAKESFERAKVDAKIRISRVKEETRLELQQARRDAKTKAGKLRTDALAELELKKTRAKARVAHAKQEAATELRAARVRLADAREEVRTAFKRFETLSE